MDGIVIDYLKSKTERGRVQPDMSPTLMASGQVGEEVVAGTSFDSDRVVDAGGLSDPVCVKHVPKIYVGVDYSESPDWRRPRDAQEEMCPTVTATGKIGVAVQDGEMFSIRRLTPRECWRLMGFPDDAFDRASGIEPVSGITIMKSGKTKAWTGSSEAQLYKQAGDSIAVPVLENIFRKMFADRRKRDIQSWSE